MNVLSLFDGMSCGQIALEKARIKVSNYFASEVDKHAIKVTKTNYPSTVHVGSVTEVTYIDGYVCDGAGNAHQVGQIDLLIGGSPCQNFSFAGTRKGMVTKDNIEILSLDQYLELKSAGFAFQGESFLFWEYVRLLREIQRENPDVKFLLENVKMSKKWSDLITSIIGVEPVLINSALVSAQNRQRLYWTNIPGIAQPEDRGILLKDIIEDDVEERYELTQEGVDYMCRSSDKWSGGKRRLDIYNNDVDGKAHCLTANMHKGIPYGVMAIPLDRHPQGGRIVGRRIKDGKRADNDKSVPCIQRLEINENPNKSNCLTTVQKDTVVAFKAIEGVERMRGEDGQVFWRVPEATKKGFVDVKPGEFVDLTFIKSKTRRGRKMGEKSNCLTATSYDYCQATEYYFRKLTPIECERLQTVPDNYTNHVSNSQRYRMLGNGWTVDVIAHIFRNIEQQAQFLEAAE